MKCRKCKEIIHENYSSIEFWYLCRGCNHEIKNVAREWIKKDTLKVIPQVNVNCNPKIDFGSHFYKNCKIARKRKYKCCNECPFRNYIELMETYEKNKEALDNLNFVV